jgi:hypothetical protein
MAVTLVIGVNAFKARLCQSVNLQKEQDDEVKEIKQRNISMVFTYHDCCIFKPANIIRGIR